MVTSFGFNFSRFWELVYINYGIYCILNFIYLILVIFLRDVTLMGEESLVW